MNFHIFLLSSSGWLLVSCYLSYTLVGYLVVWVGALGCCLVRPRMDGWMQM